MRKEIIKGCDARGDKDSPYLTRYTLIKRKNWQLCLHVFHRSDAEDLHDHPWNFISLILWQGYTEETPNGKKRIFPGSILIRKATHTHRVELIKGKTAITMVLMGKHLRHWGFYVKGKFVRWYKYFSDNGC